MARTDMANAEMEDLRLIGRLIVSLLMAILFIPFSSAFAETINYNYDDLNRLTIIENGNA